MAHGEFGNREQGPPTGGRGGERHPSGPDRRRRRDAEGRRYCQGQRANDRRAGRLQSGPRLLPLRLRGQPAASRARCGERWPARARRRGGRKRRLAHRAGGGGGVDLPGGSGRRLRVGSGRDDRRLLLDPRARCRGSRSHRALDALRPTDRRDSARRLAAGLGAPPRRMSPLPSSPSTWGSRCRPTSTAIVLRCSPSSSTPNDWLRCSRRWPDRLRWPDPRGPGQGRRHDRVGGPRGAGADAPAVTGDGGAGGHGGRTGGPAPTAEGRSPVWLLPAAGPGPPG